MFGIHNSSTGSGTCAGLIFQNEITSSKKCKNE